MSLERWLAHRLILKHSPVRKEIADLLGIAEVALRDAEVVQISPDNRYSCAFKAARCLCDIAVRAEGYRVSKGPGSHERVIESLEHTLGSQHHGVTSHLLMAGRKRNVLDYDIAGTVTTREVGDLLAAVKQLRADVVRWLRERHPDLMPR